MYVAVIFDIDGTLSIVGDRLKYITGKNRDYDAFYEACDQDEPNEDMIELYRLVKCGLYDYSGCGSPWIILVTGRPERVRAKTEKWLTDHGIMFDGLLMRKDGDYRKDYVFKEEMVDSLKALGYTKILFAVEDRKAVVDMYRRKGITCLQCAEGKY